MRGCLLPVDTQPGETIRISPSEQTAVERIFFPSFTLQPDKDVKCPPHNLSLVPDQ